MGEQVQFLQFLVKPNVSLNFVAILFLHTECNKNTLTLMGLNSTTTKMQVEIEKFSSLMDLGIIFIVVIIAIIFMSFQDSKKLNIAALKMLKKNMA
jgi:hypothetical protein